MCNDEGYKYLNLAEALKDSNSGYAEAAYLNNKQNGFSTSGANVVLNYLRNHAYDTADTRPNTDDIPQRTEQGWRQRSRHGAHAFGDPYKVQIAILGGRRQGHPAGQ